LLSYSRFGIWGLFFQVYQFVRFYLLLFPFRGRRNCFAIERARAKNSNKLKNDEFRIETILYTHRHNVCILYIYIYTCTHSDYKQHSRNPQNPPTKTSDGKTNRAGWVGRPASQQHRRVFFLIKQKVSAAVKLHQLRK
jgi:hypothetical protein